MASARMELRDKVNYADIKRCVGIVKRSLKVDL